MDHMSGHPTKPNLTQADLDAWANCSVADCDAKVTHDSDKCFPHTYGWAAVRKNLTRRLDEAQRKYEVSASQRTAEEIAWCQEELRKIEGRR